MEELGAWGNHQQTTQPECGRPVALILGLNSKRSSRGLDLVVRPSRRSRGRSRHLTRQPRSLTAWKSIPELWKQRIDLFSNCTTPASQSVFRTYFGSRNRHCNDCRPHNRSKGAWVLAGRRGHVLVRLNSKHRQIRHAACSPYARCSLDAFMRTTTIADETLRRVLDTQKGVLDTPV